MLLRRQPTLTVVMDNVNKTHNLAAIIRSCDAVGVQEVHAVSYREHIFTRHNAAAGSSKWVNIRLYRNIDCVYERLRETGMQILAATASKESVNFREIDYTVPTAVVLGAEKDGVSGEAVQKADRSISIPMVGMVESLNVSVACAAILFEAQRQRMLAGMYEEPLIGKDELEQLLFEYAYPRLSEQFRKKGIDYPKLEPSGLMLLPERETPLQASQKQPDGEG